MEAEPRMEIDEAKRRGLARRRDVELERVVFVCLHPGHLNTE